MPTARGYIRNRDVHFRFRPDSDFFYLTGFAEPEAVLVLVPGREQGEYLLFCREKDPKREQWDGYRAGLEGAVADFAADDAFPFADMDDIIPGLLEQRTQVFYTVGQDNAFDQRVTNWINQVRNKARTGIQAPGHIVTLDQYLHDMRLYKTANELDCARRRISASAHQAVTQTCQAGKYEYQLAATFQHHCQQQGAQSLAIHLSLLVVTMPVLHYIENRDQLQDGGLVLVDAGCELDYYARTLHALFR